MSKLTDIYTAIDLQNNLLEEEIFELDIYNLKTELLNTENL